MNRESIALALRILALPLLAILCAASVNASRFQPLPWRGDWSRHVENRALKAGVELAGLGALKQASETGAALLLDARSAAAFRAGHIRGAFSLPLNRATEALATLPIEMDPDRPIIAYCGRSGCDEGLQLALLLRRFGYRRVSLFAGGWEEWKAAGGAVETGP